MARMNAPVTMLAVAAGLILSVAVAPISNWSFKNDVVTAFSDDGLGALFGSFRSARERFFFEGAPPTLFDAKQIPTNTKESRLARALGLAEWDTANPVGDWEHGIREGLKELESYCKDNPTDVPALAHFARLLSQGLGGITPNAETKAKKQYQEQLIRMKPIFEQLLATSEKGASLDPQNAYWPLMQATALAKLERTQECKLAFLLGAECAGYEDYAVADPRLCLSEFDKRWGYRGEAVRLMIPASVLFPQYASFKGLFKKFCIAGDKPGDLKMRWAGIKLAQLMMRDGSTAICMLVGRAALAIAVVGTEKMPEEIKKNQGDEHYALVHKWEQSLASQLDAKLINAGISVGSPGPGAIFADSEKLMQATRNVIGDPADSRVTEHPFAGAAATALGLAAFLLFIPICLAAWAWCGKAPEAYDRSRLFFVGALFYTELLVIRIASRDTEVVPRTDADLFVISMLALFGVSFAAALMGKSHKVLLGACLVTGAVAVLGSVILSPIPYGEFLVGALTVLYLLLAYRMPTHVVTMLFIVGAAAVNVFSLLRFENIDPTSQMRMAAMTLVLLVCAAPSKWFRNWAAASTLILSICFVGATAYSLKINTELKSFNRDWLREADIIREQAGIGKQSASQPP